MRYHNLFLNLPDDEHLSCFQFLAIENKAAINILIQNFVWMYV